MICIRRREFCAVVGGECKGLGVARGRACKQRKWQQVGVALCGNMCGQELAAHSLEYFLVRFLISPDGAATCAARLTKDVFLTIAAVTSGDRSAGRSSGSCYFPLLLSVRR